MDFKSIINNDIDVFMNLSEFGEVHTVNGKEITVIISSNLNQDKSSKKQNQFYYGISQDSLVLTAKEQDLEIPREGDRIELDGVYYSVVKVAKNDRILDINISKVD